MNKDLQKKKRGLVVIDDKVPVNGSQDLKMQDLPLTQPEDVLIFKDNMSKPGILGNRPKNSPSPGSYYSF